jgi:predicted amidohydrolase
MQLVAVQLDIQWESRLANHQQVLQLLSQTTIAPDSLIVLPEMFDTGFSMNLNVTAQGVNRQSELFLRDLAIRYRSTVLGGVVAPQHNGKSANEAVAFAPDGQLLVRYQKQRPFSLVREGDHYLAGESFKLFQWNGVQVAPFICYDLRFPELFRPAALAGAELLVAIACWPAVRSEHWVRLLQARAIENLAATLGVNRCGEEPGLLFDGRSCAFDHMGNQLFQGGAEAAVLQATLDIDNLRRWRKKFPALRDAAT